MKLLLFLLTLLTLPLSGYEFKSLKGLAHQDFFDFFDGKEEVDEMLAEMGLWTDDRLPKGFWQIDDADKETRALVEENRTPKHRKGFEVILPSKEELPKSGWLHFSFGSSVCYSFTSRDVLLKFGSETPLMFVIETNSVGVVGSNPWADHPAQQAFEVLLTRMEADRLAGILLRLGLMKTKERVDDAEASGWSSTADGSATLHLFETGKEGTQLLFGIVWSTGSIKKRWAGEFSDANASASFIELLLTEGLKSVWARSEEMAPQGMDTPDLERLSERISKETRETTLKTLKKFFEEDRKFQLPAGFLRECVSIVGEDAMVDLRGDLDRLTTTISEEPGKVEKALLKIWDKFLPPGEPMDPGDPFREEEGLDVEAEEDRLNDLIHFHRGFVLRESLELARAKLNLVGRENYLVVEVQKKGRLAQWALGSLGRNYRDAWLAEMSQQFREAQDAEGRLMIFETITGVDAEAGKVLISTLNEKRFEELMIPIAAFRLEHQPSKLPAMFPKMVKLLLEGALEDYQRNRLTVLLAKMPLEGVPAIERRNLIIQQFSDPPFWSTAETRFRAFAELPAEAGDMEFLWSRQMFPEQDVELAIRLLRSRVIDPDEQRSHLERLMKHQIANQVSEVDKLVQVCLAFDLRKFASEIADLATQGPDEQGGERFHSARFLTALWSEQDPETLAKMWIDWMAIHTWGLDDDYFPMPLLKKRCREVVGKLNGGERGKWIEEAISFHVEFRFEPQAAAWLRSLK